MLAIGEPKASKRMEKKTSNVPLFRAPASPEPKPASKGTKVAIITAFLASALALVGLVLLYQSLETEREQRASLETTRIHLQDQNDSLLQTNARFRSQIGRLREQVKTYSVENAKIKKELDQGYAEIANMRGQITELEDRNAALNAEIEQLRYVEPEPVVEEPVVESYSFEYEEETPTLEGQDLPQTANLFVDPEIEEPIALVDEETAEVEEVVPAEELVSEEVAPAFQPQVMTVNRRFNFVVVNMGMQQNLKMGDQMQVERDGDVIASLQVEKLYDRFAAATILDESDKSKIEKGDQIRLL